MYLLGHGYLVGVWHGNNWGWGRVSCQISGKIHGCLFASWCRGVRHLKSEPRVTSSRGRRRERERAYDTTKRRHLAHLLRGNDRPNVRRHIQKFWIVPSSCREEKVCDEQTLVFPPRQFRLSLIYVLSFSCSQKLVPTSLRRKLSSECTWKDYERRSFSMNMIQKRDRWWIRCTPSTEEGIDLAKLVKSQNYPFNESLCPYIMKRLSRVSFFLLDPKLFVASKLWKRFHILKFHISSFIEDKIIKRSERGALRGSMTTI